MELRLGHPKRAIPLLERASHMGIEAGGCEILARARAYEEVGQLKRAMYVLEREASEYSNFIRVPLELAALLARHGTAVSVAALPLARAAGRQYRWGEEKGRMLYMVLEHFKGDPVPVYRRFRDEGRLAPEGLRYVDSWVTQDLQRCFQIVDCDDPVLLHAWMDRWRDLVTFEVTPIVTSAQAVATIGPRL
jgi:hypothetical protein